MSAPETLLKPICFVVMPFGTKPTGSVVPNAPDRVDFDAVWNEAYAPALRRLGYEPVRADQDVGALIVKEMIERLALSDLVIADVSIPNGNVYYEVGVRHAACEEGCVLVSADWARPLFDLDPMRRLTFPLPTTRISGGEALAIGLKLEIGIPALAKGRSPVHESIQGYPGAVDASRATSFRQRVMELAAFQGAIAGARAASPNGRAAACLAVRDQYVPAGRPITAGVAIELIRLLRDCVGWEAVLEFVESLSESLKALSLIAEQNALALSKAGRRREAIARLEALIKIAGPSPEREGLLGGCYKALHNQAEKDGNYSDSRLYLDRAIEHYDRGARLDLNDFFPSSNLPRLLRKRGEDGDEASAISMAHVVRIACERALQLNSTDEWVRPTLLGAAFDAGDVATARSLSVLIKRDGHAAWKIESTLGDLELSVRLQKDDSVRQALSEIIQDLRKHVTR